MENNYVTASAAKAAEQEVNRQRLIEQEAEKKLHAEIVQKLRNVRGFLQREDGEDGPEDVWKENKLSLDELRFIMQRGHTDEIQEMISHYGIAADGYQHLGKAPFILFPPEIEVMIIERNVTAEIREFARYHGFGEAGQDALLKCVDPITLAWYLEQHGLLPKQQKKLLTFDDPKLIQIHARKHGLAEETFDGILDELEHGKTENFYAVIQEREFPPTLQKRLIEVAQEHEFMAYIERYGFWEIALPDLARKRSCVELEAYIRKHRYLGEGATDLVARGSNWLNYLYADKMAKDVQWFLEKMLRHWPLDYRALAALFRRIPYQNDLPEDQQNAINLFLHGSEAQVLDYIKQEKPKLGPQALGELFFSNLPVAFETYLKQDQGLS